MKRPNVCLTKEYLLFRTASAGDYINTLDLLNFGVDPGAMGNAAIKGACRAGRKRIIELLWDRGADPYQCSLSNLHLHLDGPAIRGAVAYDCLHERLEIVPLLLHRKACPLFPLQAALLMLERGNKSWAQKGLGEYMIDTSAKYYPAADLLPGLPGPWVPYLVQHFKVDPNRLFPNSSGGQQTALARAVDYMDVSAMKGLLDCGADPNAVPFDHPYLVDPDNAQSPELAWEMLRLLANAKGSSWELPVDKLAEII